MLTPRASHLDLAALPLWAAALVAALLTLSQPAAAPQREPLVVVVEGDILGPGGESMASRMRQFTDAAYAALDAARVPYRITADSVVERRGLPAVRVAILPYNRAVTDAELARLQGFMDQGGKLIVCYVGRSELLSRLGVSAGDFVEVSRPGQFAGIRLNAPDILGLPEIVAQTSWGVRDVSATSEGRVIAYWQDAEGNIGQQPAVILGPDGAYLSHVILPGGAVEKGALLRALAAHFAPELWWQAVPHDAVDLGPVGPYASLAEMLNVLQRSVGPARNRALRRGLQAADSLAAARRLLEQGKAQEAVGMSDKAQCQVVEAHWMSYESAPGELRGCWTGAMPQPSWDEAMKNLTAANFNAAFPYIVSSGTAFYGSSILPKNARCGESDPLAEAVAAAKKYGVELHARMLNLTCLFGDDAIVQAYKSQGRAMVSADGKKCDWLCPSNPKNRDLQVRIARELVTKYDIDGLQLDYLRYPGKDYCYCDTCRQRFQQQTGVRIDKWPDDVRDGGRYERQFADWRREQLNGIVREIAAAVRQVRPGLPISAAVFVRWDRHRNTFGQDWVRWIDEGTVDFVCPMDYTSDMNTFREWASLQREWIGGKVPWAVGIGPFATNVSLDVQGVADQIQIGRELGANGFVVFNYQPELASEYLPHLALGITAEATKFVWRR